MKRIVLALMVGFGAALDSAAPAIAEDTAPTTATSGAPVVVAGTTDFVSTAPATRRGLFARLRVRRTGSTMMTMPANATVVPIPSTTVPVPMPMPKPSTATPASGTVTMSPMVATAAYTTTSQPTRAGLFGRMRSRSTATTVPMPMPMSGVIPAAGTVTMEPMTSNTMMASATTSTRLGLLARLRARTAK